MNSSLTAKSTKALILTVGTGDINKLETSLFAPLKKSIKKGEWEKIILLPSQMTKSNAHALSDMTAGMPIEINPLPKAKQEDDADACFNHFDQVIGSLLSDGFLPQNIMVDFTRGTKAMSAAMVLASIRRELNNLRYISGPRDERGQVLPGQEAICEINPQISLASLRLDTALRFISRGAFAAACDLLPDPDSPYSKLLWPQSLWDNMTSIRSMAQFYLKWDKFDYGGAFRIAESKHSDWSSTKKTYSSWTQIFPTKEMRKWTQTLAEPLNKGHKQKPPVLRKIAADILANAERRARDSQFEDAVVRAYRIRELIAQIRLFERGLDSEAVPKDHPALVKVKVSLEKKGRSWHPGEGGAYQASREKAAMLLNAMGDPLGNLLLQERNDGILSSKSRNNSLLIHGFRTLGDVDKKALMKDFKTVEQLLHKDNPDHAERHLQQARSINFGMD